MIRFRHLLLEHSYRKYVNEDVFRVPRCQRQSDEMSHDGFHANEIARGQ